MSRPNFHTGETYSEKALRKFKENPLVPVGALATCGALVMATIKMRKGDSRSFNHWLRARVAAQALTVAFVCAGAWSFSHDRDPESTKTRQLDEIAAHREERITRERAEFEDRLKEATRAYESERTNAPAVGHPTASSHGTEGTAPKSSWWSRS